MQDFTREKCAENNNEDIDARCGEGKFDVWKLLELSRSLSSQSSAMLK